MSADRLTLFPVTIGVPHGFFPAVACHSGWMFYATVNGIDQYNGFMTPAQLDAFDRQMIEATGQPLRREKPGAWPAGFHCPDPVAPKKEKVARTPFSWRRWLAIRWRRYFVRPPKPDHSTTFKLRGIP